MKSTILMTTAIFLASAPAPDSKTVAEISAGFLAPSIETALAAAEIPSAAQLKSDVEISKAKRLETLND